MTSRLLLALSLLASVLLLAAVGMSLRDIELARLREQRFHTLIGELREKIETDLHIGLELADTSRTQGLLEDAAARIPQLLSVEVVSDQGVSLFNSDRGLRGQPTPPTWSDAARRTPEGWRVDRQDERSLGVPLRDSTGQSVGQLVLTHRIIPVGENDTHPLTAGLAVGGVAALLVLTLLGLRDRRTRLQLQADMAGLSHDGSACANSFFPASELARRLADARAALDTVDREARRIAGADT